MKPNYIGHDKAYKRLKAEGKQGWDPTPEITQENISELEKVLQAGYAPKKGKLLELGCGAGNITLWLAGQGYDVYGIDIAPTAVAWAREKAQAQNLKADFRAGNVLDLKDYPDNSFDFILDGHCFHCIIGQDRKLFLSAAGRVLKPKGFLLINTMSGEVTGAEMKKQFDAQSRCLVANGIATRYIGLADVIIDEIKRAGFDILHHQVKPRKNEEDFDTLLVQAVKP